MAEASQNLRPLMFLIIGMINMLTYEMKYTTGNDLLYKLFYIQGYRKRWTGFETAIT